MKTIPMSLPSNRCTYSQHYKVPRYVEFVSEFPTTVSGKIQKFKMREQMCRKLQLGEQETA